VVFVSFVVRIAEVRFTTKSTKFTKGKLGLQSRTFVVFVLRGEKMRCSHGI